MSPPNDTGKVGKWNCKSFEAVPARFEPGPFDRQSLVLTTELSCPKKYRNCIYCWLQNFVHEWKVTNVMRLLYESRCNVHVLACDPELKLLGGTKTLRTLWNILFMAPIIQMIIILNLLLSEV